MKNTKVRNLTLTVLLLASVCLLGGCGDKKNNQPAETTTAVTTTAETADTADITEADGSSKVKDEDDDETPLMSNDKSGGDSTDSKNANASGTTATTAKNGSKSGNKDGQQGGMIQTEEGEVILTLEPPKQTEPATLPNSDAGQKTTASTAKSTEKQSEAEQKTTSSKAQEQDDDFKLSTNEDGAIVLPFVPFE